MDKIINLPTGNCVVCGRFLGRADYDEQQVIAATDGNSSCVVCVSHVAKGPNSMEYKNALAKLSDALINATRRN